MKKVLLSILSFLVGMQVLSPLQVAKLKYRIKLGKKLDLDNPEDLNQKINWLKFNSDTSLWSELSDKYKVRAFVEKHELHDILVPFYGKWNRAEDIEWDTLPDRFVLKMNNGCGDIIVCHNKKELERGKVERYFQRLLKKPYGLATGEPHYSKITPYIIAEELLDCKKQPIESSSLIDYKIGCSYGKPHYILACYNRTAKTVETALYDLQWKLHPEYFIATSHCLRAKTLLPKPANLDRMLAIAGILSANFPEVRVDLYEVDGKVYFGEMSFTGLGGYIDYFTPEFLLLQGNKILLTPTL
ncbi:MAG: glycosyltransferase [Parabacteroides sp.]|nr:glycosyltransferase [Parabacteroides sp.]